MENNKQESRCSGNCMNCNPFQRQFCASQLAFNNMLMMEQIMRLMKKVEDKVDAMQNDEAALIDPLAQEGDGAKVEAPK